MQIVKLVLSILHHIAVLQGYTGYTIFTVLRIYTMIQGIYIYL
jgi:hypothetical protein